MNWGVNLDFVQFWKAILNLFLLHKLNKANYVYGTVQKSTGLITVQKYCTNLIRPTTYCNKAVVHACVWSFRIKLASIFRAKTHTSGNLRQVTFF